MRWSNVDLDRRLWTILGRTSKPEDDHHVPLSDAMIHLLLKVKAEQEEGWGDFVFSASHGQRPIRNISRHKTAFQKVFIKIFRELAPGRELRDWRWHDVRRTVRTHLEPIVSRSEVAEAAIGHGKMGIERVYNLYKYRREIRAAFNIWSSTLQKMEQGTLTFEDWEH
jgi:integrase